MASRSEPRPTNLGRILRRWRVAEELEQATVADRIGINHSTLCRLEIGDGLASAETLVKLLAWMIQEVK